MNQQQYLFPPDSGALFSEDRKYRYYLWRTWSKKSHVMFICLNPSTANETDNDPTIRRVIQFAKDWGYGGVYMCNLFAWVSSNPKDLLTCADPVGFNDQHLRWIALMCHQQIVFAWGSFKEAKERARQVSEMFPRAMCLGLNKDGSPKHPLYIKANTSIVNYK